VAVGVLAAVRITEAEGEAGEPTEEVAEGTGEREGNAEGEAATVAARLKLGVAEGTGTFEGREEAERALVVEGVRVAEAATGGKLGARKSDCEGEREGVGEPEISEREKRATWFSERPPVLSVK